MDVLSLYQGRALAPLDDMAKLCGFPGKLGMDGSQVWPAFRQGKLKEIRDYCETDAANTYLLFLRYQSMRGALTPKAYEEEITLVRDTLSASTETHWMEFMAAWGRP